MDRRQHQLEQELAEYTRRLELVEQQLAEARRADPLSEETKDLKQERNDLEDEVDRIRHALQQCVTEEQKQASASEKPYHVFLSFHTEDRAAVQKIAIYLQANFTHAGIFAEHKHVGVQVGDALRCSALQIALHGVASFALFAIQHLLRGFGQ